MAAQLLVLALCSLWAAQSHVSSQTSALHCEGPGVVMHPILRPMPTCATAPSALSSSDSLSAAAVPYLSVVTATRNDRYGGALPSAWRTQQHVHNVAKLALCYNLSVEHIVVDWNPDPSLPPLAATLGCAAYRHVRLLTVSAAQHAEALNASRCLPERSRAMLELHAKNVGIRRSRGKYVLVVNNDNLFSSSLLKFLALQQLCPNVLYTAVRYNLPETLWAASGGQPSVRCGGRWEAEAAASGRPHWAEKLPAAVRRHVSRTCDPLRYSYANLGDPKVAAAAKKGGIFSGAPGDFNLAHRSAFTALNGIPELCTRGAMDIWVVNALAGSSKGHVLFISAALFHQFHRSAPYNAKRVSAADAFHAGLRRRPLKPQPHWGLRGVAVAEGPLTQNCTPCPTTPPGPPPPPAPPPAKTRPPAPHTDPGG